MRLLTHNLMCCIKCKTFPLTVEASEITIHDQPFDLEFIQRMLGRVEYPALVAALEDVRRTQSDLLYNIPALPSTLEELLRIEKEDPAVLERLHFALSGFAVKNGEMVCSACETRFPIVEYIPNMMVE